MSAVRAGLLDASYVLVESADLGTGLRSTSGVTDGALGRLAVLGGVFLGFYPFILSEIGLRPMAESRDILERTVDR